MYDVRCTMWKKGACGADNEVGDYVQEGTR